MRPGVRPRFDYTFFFLTAGGCQPVRFNPCQPVRYALNRTQATDAHVADLLEGLRKLSAATGLEFERVGDTFEDPRQVPRPRRRPDGTFAWPAVVIGWSHLGSGVGLGGRGETRASPDVVVGGGGRPRSSTTSASPATSSSTSTRSPTPTPGRRCPMVSAPASTGAGSSCMSLPT